MESVIEPKLYEIFRPQMSAMIPVITSNTTWPKVNKPFITNAWKLLKPALSKKMVLIPQIKDVASVLLSTKYT